MCNFNKQSDDTKSFLHLFLKKAAECVGGENFLLELIESMRSIRPNPLILKEKKVVSKECILEWQKVVFRDKFDILDEIITIHKTSESENLNILNIENQKKRKKVLNMVKTLAPLEFVIKPKNQKNGSGFSFGVFDKVDDEFVKLNPVFVAFFFCSVEFSKKGLKYQID